MLVDLRFGSGTWKSIVEERARRIQAVKRKKEAIGYRKSTAKKRNI